jgi:hypothetical protein
MAALNGWSVANHNYQREALARLKLSAPKNITTPKRYESLDDTVAAWSDFLIYISIWGAKQRGRMELHDAPQSMSKQTLQEQQEILEGLQKRIEIANIGAEQAKTLMEKLMWLRAQFSAHAVYPLLKYILDRDYDRGGILAEQETEHYSAAIEALEKAGWSMSHGKMPQKFTIPVLNSKLYQTLNCMISLCRVANIRARGIAISQAMITADSSWDDKAMHIGVKLLVDMEENKRDKNGSIPYDARLLLVAVDWNRAHTELRLTYQTCHTRKKMHIEVGRDSGFGHLMNSHIPIDNE